MTTRVSARTGQEYETFKCRSKKVGEITYRESPFAPTNSVIARHEYPSRSRKNLVNVVTERVTTAADGHSSQELELARFDCGCEQYYFEYQRIGTQATCSNIIAEMDKQRVERTQAYERRLAMRAQGGDLHAAQALAALTEMYQSEELTAWAS
jgi:hypothetical protein